MPTPLPRLFPHNLRDLMDLGVRRMKLFCAVNDVPVPAVTATERDKWRVSACAYYRPDTDKVREWTKPGINICLELCSKPAGVNGPPIQQSWPGSITDREPYGVILHELGHHLDWFAGERKGTYFSDYCEAVKAEAREPGITSYADTNPAEWFAEAARLFFANHGLLREIRPRTHAVLCRRWKPVGTDDWRAVLGANVPPRIIGYLTKKGAR